LSAVAFGLLPDVLSDIFAARLLKALKFLVFLLLAEWQTALISFLIQFPTDSLWSPHSVLLIGYRCFFPQGIVAGAWSCSPPSSSAVKNDRGHTSTHPYAFIVWTWTAWILLLLKCAFM